VILDKKSAAGQAYARIAKRICGEKLALEDIENEQEGMFKKLAGIFK
jgi:septum formation inhibitor-activating ATPase MinD